MLGFNPDTRAFYVVADDDEKRKLARATGLDRSVPASTRQGCDVFVTRDEYAALPFYKWADPLASDVLFMRALEYRDSYAEDYGSDFPHPPETEFMPFQKAGISYCLQRKNALIGDQPGLGKTMQAIGVANAIEAQRVLVVCPARTRLQWRKEVGIWSTISAVNAYPILRSADGVNPFAHYTIVSYDLARQKEIHRALMAPKYDLLVLDEAHYLKSVEAKRTHATFGGLRQITYSGGEGGGGGDTGLGGPLAERADRILALTGTPLPNRPRECYNLARHLCWDAIDWISEDTFQHRYNPSFRWPSGRVEERKGRLPELRSRLRCNLMVRRLKARVLPQLPDKQYELTYIEPNGAIRKVLRAESLLDIDPDHLEEIDAKTWGAISTVRREMGIAKVPRVCEHVQGLLGGGLDKVVIFAHHREVMALLEEALAGFGVVVIKGGVTPTQSFLRVQQFAADPSIRIFLAQLQAGGTGVDGLQKACSHAVFAEASWTPGDNEQCVDRLHRMLQQYAVLAQFLVAPGSLDERILGRAIRKMRNIHETLDAD